MQEDASESGERQKSENLTGRTFDLHRARAPSRNAGGRKQSREPRRVHECHLRHVEHDWDTQLADSLDRLDKFWRRNGVEFTLQYENPGTVEVRQLY